MIKTSQSLASLIHQPLSGTPLASVAFSADGLLFAIADHNGNVDLWQTQTDHPPRQIQRLQPTTGFANPSATDPSATDRTATDPSGSPSEPVSVIRQLAFSPDGQKLVGVGVDWKFRLWEVPKGKLLQQLSGHEAFVEQAQFSPDGTQLISASWDRTARIWDLASGKLKATFAHQDTVTSAHFSPDGKRIVTTSLDGTARVLNPANGTLEVIFAGHRGAVLDAGFSPDGRSVVTASANGSVRLWDANTGVEKALLRPPKTDNQQEAIKQVIFSPDGQYVATLSSNGKLHLWAATWQGLLELARDRSHRQLKPDECLRYLRLPPNTCPSLTLGHRD